MPIRSMNTSTGRVGRTESECEPVDADFCVGGICLTTRQEPEHDEYLEAMLTGRYNVFSPDALDHIFLYRDNMSGDDPLLCYYSAIWNLAIYGIRHGKRPHDASTALRQIVDSGYPSNLTFLKSELLPNSFRAEESSRRSTSRMDQDRTQPIHPAITDNVLRVLAEEGILEEDAQIAVSALIRNGTLRSSTLKEGGPLFVYGSERRHIVSRVLNYIHSSRETEQPLFENASRNAFNPLTDMLTGSSVGFSSGQ